MGGIMIEDQVAPKRCGHVAGKSVVPFDEAVKRVKLLVMLEMNMRSYSAKEQVH